MTTGAAGGGQSNKQKTDGEEAIGGDREYAQANCTELHCDCNGAQVTQVNLGGRRGGTRAIF